MSEDDVSSDDKWGESAANSCSSFERTGNFMSSNEAHIVCSCSVTVLQNTTKSSLKKQDREDSESNMTQV